MGQCSIFLVALFPFLVYGSEPRASLEGVVYALERLVGYYKNNYKQINLDGLYGLRTLEGQFILIDSERERGLLDHIPLSILSRIKAMELQTTKICKEAIEFVRNDDEKYFEQMRYVIERPWMIFKKEKKINEKLRWDSKHYKRTSGKVIEETTSDQCMMELFGSATTPKCSISNKCAEIMTHRGHMEYSITHQVLWSMLAEQVGCLEELNKVLLWFNFKNVEEMHIEFCSNNFFEMKHLVHSYLSEVIPPFYQDLFMEQQFVCPSIGFSEFLHLNYLKQLLSWMKPNGCYGTMPAVKAKNISTFYSSMKIEDYYDQAVNDGKFAKNDIKQTVFSVTAPKTKLKPNRPLLAEPSLQESAHKVLKQKSSSVAASSLIKSFSNQHQDPFVQQMLAKSLRKNHAKLRLAHMGPAKSVASNTLNRVGLAPLLIQPNRTGLTVNATRQRNGPPPLIMELNKAGSYARQDGIKHHRKLLVEKVLSDGCLSHKTATAAGTLAVYLNFLLHHTLDQLNHSDNVWHSVSQRLLLHTASDMQQVKKPKLPFPLERKDMDLMIPDLADRREPAAKVGVQEPILGDAGMGLVSNHKDDAGEDNDYDEYEDDKFPGENYHDKKVVHFGNNKESLKSLDENAEDYDNESLDEDEDGDYTYYDENDEGLEKQERVNKQKKYFQNTGIEKKQIVPRIPRNSAFQGRSAHEGHESFSDNSSPTGIVLITVTFTLVLLLLLMYRFIKKRRIHIRYNPTSFLKL